jgi:hypothetical protein
MNAPRRRLLRTTPPVESAPRRTRRVQRQHEQLAKERASLSRWMARLKRAFHAMEKSQARIAWLERSLPRLERD